MKPFPVVLPIRATRRLVDVEGMTADDWERVWFAYQGFLAQVNLIVASVQEREAKRKGKAS